MKTLNYYWRLFATGLSFIVFGIGGVLIPIVVVPILVLLPGEEKQKQVKIRKLVHYCFKAFVHMVRVLGLLTWETEGLERLQKNGLLVLANHPTLLDVVFLVSFIPNAVCIVKSQLTLNPVMRGFIKRAGYITNDKGEVLITSSKEALSQGGNLIIFPEGTRTRDGNPLSFQRGAANIAVRTPVMVTPVKITCSPPTLSKQHKWHDIPDKPFRMSFEVCENIPIAPYVENNATQGARRLTKYLESYFSEEENINEYRRTGT